MVKIDLHVHTDHSYDSFISVKELILEAKNKGLDGIGIADHNTMSAVKEAVEIGGKIGILVIPGEEISSKEGDILALGIEKEIKKGLSARETIDKIHEQGGIAIAAHPYGFIKHHNCVRDLVKELDFDAIEVFNSSNIIENKKAIEMARKLNLVGVAGSDAHVVGEVGRAYTIIDCDSDIKSILAGIKKGNVSWQGKRTAITKEVEYFLRRLYSFFNKKKSLQES